MICLSPLLLLTRQLCVDAVVQTYWWPSVWCRQPHYTPKYSVIHTETSEEHCLTTSIVGRLLICTNNVSYIFYTIFSLFLSPLIWKSLSRGTLNFLRLWVKKSRPGAINVSCLPDNTKLLCQQPFLWIKYKVITHFAGPLPWLLPFRYFFSVHWEFFL